MPINLRRHLAWALLSLGISAAPAGAGWLSTLDDPTADDTHSPVRLVQAGCSAAAAQAAADSGGQVLSVQVAQRDGQTVCVVTVLVPARDGNRPRRQTITVPQ